MLTYNAVTSGGASPFTYAWAVTGGSPASGTASSFTTSFAVKGTYNVTLTVTDNTGKTAKAFELVSIKPLPLIVAVGGPTTGTVNTAVSFTATVSGGTTPYAYAWAVTGGSPATGTASTFSTTFSVKGTYNVTLTVTDHNGVSKTAFLLVTISPLSLTVSISGPTTGTVNVAVSFSSTVSGGTSPYTYAWAVAGGNPSTGTASTFSASFATTGTFNVTLTVTDHNGKIATTFHLITITGLCSASISGPSTGTVNQLLTFNAVTSNCVSPTYSWAVTGGSPATSTASSFSTTFAVKGTYNVTLAVTPTTGTAAHAFQLVTISSLILTATISGPTSGSINTVLSFSSTVSGGTSPYAYAWAVTGGSPASGTASTFSTSFAVKGTYNVTLTVTDHNGAAKTAFQLVTVSPLALTASVSGPTAGTVNQMLTFNAVVSGGTAPYAYAWAVTGGSPASGTAASFSTSFGVGGNYNVTLAVTDHNGKTAGAFHLVAISAVGLSASISGPASGGLNQMLTYNAVTSGGTSPFTYAWAVTGGSPASGTASSFTTSFSVKGTYNVTLTVTDNAGKTANAFELVAISPAVLVASVTGPTTGSVGATLTFNSIVTGGTTPYTYAWAVTGGSPASGTSSSFATSFAVKGTFNVTLTVTDHNGAAAEAFQLVTITPLTLTASASGPATGTVGATLTYNAVVSGGTTPYTYAWAVTGGSPSSGTASSFAASFAVKGTYNVTLTVTDHNAKTASAFQLVVISPLALSADFTFNPSSPTVGQSVTFTPNVAGGTTPYSYAWNFGDGTSSTSASPSHAYNASGTFTVKLNVTDANNVVAMASHTVTVSLVTTVGDFSVSVNPSHLSLVAGGSRNVTVVVHSINFAGTVTLTVTITPLVANGPSATSSTSTVTLAINSTMISKLRLSTLASTPPGSYLVTVTATSGGLSHSTTAKLTVTGFSLTANPSSLTVQAGSSGIFHVTLESQGFSGAIHLTAINTPDVDESPSLSLRSTVMLSSGGTASATLQVSSDEHTPLGTYTIMVNATGHGLTRSLSVHVTVTDPNALHLHHHGHHDHNHDD
jgi:PKD repeat protein